MIFILFIVTQTVVYEFLLLFIKATLSIITVRLCVCVFGVFYWRHVEQYYYIIQITNYTNYIIVISFVKCGKHWDFFSQLKYENWCMDCTHGLLECGSIYAIKILRVWKWKLFWKCDTISLILSRKYLPIIQKINHDPFTFVNFL